MTADASFPDGFDRADWKAAAHLEWALRHVDAFLPTASVRTGAAVPVARAAEAFAPVVHFGGRALDWDGYLAETHATSAIVARRGTIIDERYRLGAGPNDRHMLFSITKSLVGLIAAMLAHWAVIDEEQSADHYVPELTGTAFGSARIDDLLAMTDGVAFDERYAVPAAAIHAYSRHYWGSAPGGTLTGLGRLPPGAASRGRFAYRTPVADVVALALERATGRDWNELLSELLWEPIGAEADAALVLDTGGRAIGGTGLIARTMDLVRLGNLLLDGGWARGQMIIPTDVVEQLFAGGDPGALAQAGYADRHGWSYGAFWWHLGRERIAAIGVHGQRLVIDRPSGVVFARTGAAPLPDNTPYDALHAAALEAITRA